MSESSKGIGVGEANSQYGTCWITKNGLNKKINKEELDIWVLNGWIKNNVCECGNVKSLTSRVCKVCSDKFKRQFERPSKEKLLNEVENSNFSVVARKYNVSDNTIRRWLK